MSASYRVGVRRMGPDSCQWCPATGQGATGTKWRRGSSSWTRGRTSSLWGWQSPGPGCPGRLWSLLLWRYSRPAWMRCCAACSGWPCLGRGLGWVTHRGAFQPPPFCDSVIPLTELKCSWAAMEMVPSAASALVTEYQHGAFSGFVTESESGETDVRLVFRRRRVRFDAQTA